METFEEAYEAITRDEREYLRKRWKDSWAYDAPRKRVPSVYGDREEDWSDVLARAPEPPEDEIRPDIFTVRWPTGYLIVRTEAWLKIPKTKRDKFLASISRSKPCP